MQVYITMAANKASPLLKRQVFGVRIDELPHHKLGLSFTATGYGNKIPTIYKARVAGAWRRIYSRCFSNTSFEYVIINGEECAVDIRHSEV